MPRKPRILFFTDSRGELKPTFREREIFPEKIKSTLKTRGIAVDLLLCPFKWTTTIDFIELVESRTVNLKRYDKIVLYTGVVEWSPRPASSYRDCMKGIGREPLDVKPFFRGERPRKYANHKLAFFRQFFGQKTFNAHARTNFETIYRDEPTKNLYSLDMLRHRVIPWLAESLGDRLIFINSNRIVPGWEGDYAIKNPDGRPKNVGIIEDYAALMARHFDTIDLMQWSDKQTQRFTVDNMHLTHAGSEWIYERVMRRLT